MLVSTAKTLLKRAGFDDSDPISDYLNIGLQTFETEADWAFLQVLETLTLTAGDNSLQLGATTFKPYSVRNVTHSVKLKYMPFSEFNREIDDPTQAGVPAIYTTVGMFNDTAGTGPVLQVYAVPDETVTLEVVSQTRLGVIGADNAQMPGPNYIHYACVQASKYMALQDESEEDRAANAQAQYQASVTRLLDRFTDTELDEPQQVTDVMGYGGSHRRWAG